MRVSSPQRWYTYYRKFWTIEKVESFCRQVLALCDAEYRSEAERLKREEKEILERGKRAAAMEAGIDEAPGVFITLSSDYRCAC